MRDFFLLLTSHRKRPLISQPPSDQSKVVVSIQYLWFYIVRGPSCISCASQNSISAAAQPGRCLWRVLRKSADEAQRVVHAAGCLFLRRLVSVLLPGVHRIQGFAALHGAAKAWTPCMRCLCLSAFLSHGPLRACFEHTAGMIRLCGFLEARMQRAVCRSACRSTSTHAASGAVPPSAFVCRAAPSSKRFTRARGSVAHKKSTPDTAASHPPHGAKLHGVASRECSGPGSLGSFLRVCQLVKAR